MAVLKRYETKRFVSYADESEVLTSEAALVIRVVDGFRRADPHGLSLGPKELTKRNLLEEAPLGAVTVRIENRREVRPYQKNGGLYCFVGTGSREEGTFRWLENGTHTLTVDPEPIRSDWYRPEKRSLVVKDGKIEVVAGDESLEVDPKLPVAVALSPKPAYPFPAEATLIRGFAFVRKDGRKEPVAGAAVTTTLRQLVYDGNAFVEKDQRLETSTDSKGEFVLFLKRIVKDSGEERSGVLQKLGTGNNAVNQAFQVVVRRNDGEKAEITVEIRPRGKKDGNDAGDGTTRILREGQTLALQFVNWAS